MKFDVDYLLSFGEYEQRVVDKVSSKTLILILICIIIN